MKFKQFQNSRMMLISSFLFSNELENRKIIIRERYSNLNRWTNVLTFKRAFKPTQQLLCRLKYFADNIMLVDIV